LIILRIQKEPDHPAEDPVPQEVVPDVLLEQRHQVLAVPHQHEQQRHERQRAQDVAGHTSFGGQPAQLALELLAAADGVGDLLDDLDEVTARLLLHDDGQREDLQVLVLGRPPRHVGDRLLEGHAQLLRLERAPELDRDRRRHLGGDHLERALQRVSRAQRAGHHLERIRELLRQLGAALAALEQHEEQRQQPEQQRQDNQQHATRAEDGERQPDQRADAHVGEQLRDGHLQLGLLEQSSRRAATLSERSMASMAGLTASLPMRSTPDSAAAPAAPSADRRRFSSSFRRSLRKRIV
jgi:hypothetical protein